MRVKMGCYFNIPIFNSIHRKKRSPSSVQNLGGMFNYYDEDDHQPVPTTIMQIKQSGC